MGADIYLETYIVPVCSFKQISGAVRVTACFGTAFFIDDRGTFLTAGHVIDDANAYVEKEGGYLGLCPRPPGNEKNVASKINSLERAGSPFDIVVGTVGVGLPTQLTLGQAKVGAWRDVAAYGYTASAMNVSADGFWMYGRGFKGYIHREVKEGHIPGGNHPDAFETSFAIPKGLSGAPLIIAGQPKDIVVGVCIGVNRGETVDFLLEERHEDGTLTVERISRIEEYGLAHDLRPLLSFRVSSLNGVSLEECAV